MQTTVSENYILGIKEGRQYFNQYGGTKEQCEDQIDNLRRTIKGFSVNSPVGQMLRGELDFWKNQLKNIK